MDDSRQIRDRQREPDEGRQPPGGGPPTIAVQTTKINSYPTMAGVYYAVQAVDVYGPEVEGQPGTLTVTGQPFFALNIGTGIPPMGTPLVASEVPADRWAFRFDA